MQLTTVAALAIAGQHIVYTAVQRNGRTFFLQALESRQGRKEFQKDMFFCAVGWGAHFLKQSFSYFLQKHHMWYLQVMGNRTHFCSTCHPLLDAAKQRNLGSPFSRFENEVLLRQTLQHSVHLWFNKPFVRPSNDCHHQAWKAKLWLDANELWVQNPEHHIRTAMTYGRAFFRSTSSRPNQNCMASCGVRLDHCTSFWCHLMSLQPVENTWKYCVSKAPSQIQILPSHANWNSKVFNC